MIGVHPQFGKSPRSHRLFCVKNKNKFKFLVTSKFNNLYKIYINLVVLKRLDEKLPFKIL